MKKLLVLTVALLASGNIFGAAESIDTHKLGHNLNAKFRNNEISCTDYMNKLLSSLETDYMNAKMKQLLSSLEKIDTELAQKIKQQLHTSQPKKFIQPIANDHHTYRLPSNYDNSNLLNEEALLEALSRSPLLAIKIPEYIHQIDFKKLPPSLSMQLQHLLHTTPKEALAKTPVPAQLKYAYLNQQYKELLTKLIPYTQSENDLLFKAVALQWIRSIKTNKPIEKSVHQELERLAATFPANFKESLFKLERFCESKI